jgi:ATP-dependent helicase/nuclease subunit A
VSPPLADRAARERIANDLDANLVVEAAAGTGKTTVLVARVVNLLASGKVNVDQLVVITFTEKAAAELATRVRDELERRALAADGDERARLLAASRDLYRAHIETIHSFATALLRERPVEAGIDPLFEVLQGVAASLDFDTAYERFQDDLLTQELPELETALRRGLGLQELREACERLHEHRYLLPLTYPDTPADDVGQLQAKLQAVAAKFREMLSEHQPGDDKAVAVVERILEWIDALEALDPVGQERMLLFRKPARTNRGVGSNANWGGQDGAPQAAPGRL